MKTEWGKRLIKVAAALFAVYVISILSVIVYILAWKAFIISLMVAATSTVILLLTVATMGNITEYEGNNTNYKNNSFYHKVFKNIFANIWLRVNPCFSKYLKIIHSIDKTESIDHTNNATNNHALHKTKLPQDGEEVNQNGTIPNQA